MTGEIKGDLVLMAIMVVSIYCLWCQERGVRNNENE